MSEVYKKASPIGLHLYANTGRTSKDYNGTPTDTFRTGLKSWANELPPLMPWSYQSFDEVAAEEYEEALRNSDLVTGAYGILVPCFDFSSYGHNSVSKYNTVDYFLIRKTPDLNIEPICQEDFWDEIGTFQLEKWEIALSAAWDRLHNLHGYVDKDGNPHRPDNNYTEIKLINDGDIIPDDATIDAVRKDHYMRRPRLREIVHDELKKRRSCIQAIRDLEEIGKAAGVPCD